VRATLESRRPTLTREHTAQLVASYRHRAAGTGVETRQAASSWIKEMGYNSEARQATIVMSPTRNNPTGAYVYDMDPDTWGRMSRAGSAGKAYNTYVRKQGNASVDVATQCEDCGRYYGSATEHACRAAVSWPSHRGLTAPTSWVNPPQEGAREWTPHPRRRCRAGIACPHRPSLARPWTAP